MEHQTASQPVVSIVLVTTDFNAPVDDWGQVEKRQPSFNDVGRNKPDNAIVPILSQAIRAFTNDTPVSVGFSRLEPGEVTTTIEQSIAQGAQRVVIVPATLTRTPETESKLPQLVDELQAEHPNVEMIYVNPPFDVEYQAKLILENIREHLPRRLAVATEPLSALAAGVKAVVVKLVGGHDMLGRMATLGFTPGAEVTVVQNFGHGPLIISVRDARIALGRGEAGKIYVRQLGEPGHPDRQHAHRNGWQRLSSVVHSAMKEGAKAIESAKNDRRRKRGWGWLNATFHLTGRERDERGRQRKRGWRHRKRGR